MIAEILSVGTEILLGEILNTNSKFLSEELALIGIDVYNHTSVGDNEKRLTEAIEIAFKRADIIITTGGLGPTDDDLTKEVISKYFGKKLITHNPTIENMKKYFNNSDGEMPVSNLKQAEMPEGCTIFMNDNGTASGCMIEENGKIAIMLPGPPNEVIPMFKDKIKPYLIKKSEKVLISKSLNLCGIGESDASEIIKDLMLNSKNPTIAPYAGKNEVRFRITASGKNEDEAKKLLTPTIDKLYKIFKDYIYGENDETIEIAVINKLKEKNMTIATAESCTGGMLASTMINVPDVSSVFLNGAITYSNESKISMLNVNKDDLLKYGAVSKEIAIQMAEGIRKKSNAKIGISTTGIAGPNGGTKEKPVGLVYLGISIEGKEAIYKELMLTGDRTKIREKAVNIALYELLKILKNL
ncbi:MAG: competence/damage-inducible protein A [Eubacteriales bacterium]|nr:competence/damage-inducible protein A [Eubacteriales bacterium]